MKIILSRKAFDTASGGCPSPILADGRIVPLPIPDRASPIRYADISWDDVDVGAMVSDLTRGRIPATHRAHLDPDLNPTAMPREPGWRPLFGQDGPAAGHLRNHGVGVGDLFLFFGLFRTVRQTDGRYAVVPRAASRHVIWGWLQVGSVIQVDGCPPEAVPWARYHPHFHRQPSPSNVLYVAADRLTSIDPQGNHPGAGVFSLLAPRLVLTAPDARNPGEWQLPAWMAPRPGAPEPLTYHGDPSRWSVRGDSVRLATVGRGQEFILDADDHPQARPWANDLISPHMQPATPSRPNPHDEHDTPPDNPLGGQPLGWPPQAFRHVGPFPATATN